MANHTTALNRTLFTTVLAIGLACVAFSARQENLKKRPVQASGTSVVTQAECSAAFAKFEPILFRLAGVSGVLPRMQSSAAPAKRVDIVARMDRIFELVRPKFKFTPRKLRFDAKILGLPVGSPQRPALEKLIKWSCIDRAGSLATSKTESITIGDFGDALGLFIARIADVTHRPDKRFSPYLGAGDQ